MCVCADMYLLLCMHRGKYVYLGTRTAASLCTRFVTFHHPKCEDFVIASVDNGCKCKQTVVMGTLIELFRVELCVCVVVVLLHWPVGRRLV